jgi:thiamine-phosphate pyrophosphorylase
VSAALAGGSNCVQYRNKAASQELRREQALALLSLCRRQCAALIINDSLELALEIDADGCHLGRDDGSLGHARAALGAKRLLGVSCYDSLALAQAACAAGADYVAFGSVFASPVKPAAARAPLSLFRAARDAGVDCALVGIGGIELGNIDLLIAAGADAAAVITALFAHDTVEQVRECAARLTERFPSTPPHAATPHEREQRQSV